MTTPITRSTPTASRPAPLRFGLPGFFSRRTVLAVGIPRSPPLPAATSGQRRAQGRRCRLSPTATPTTPRSGRERPVRFLEGDPQDRALRQRPGRPGIAQRARLRGDTVTTAHGRGEIQLASGTLVRLDENSRVTFLSLPGGAGDRTRCVQVSEGSANIEVHGALSRRKDFRVDTPSASVYLLASRALPHRRRGPLQEDARLRLPGRGRSGRRRRQRHPAQRPAYASSATSGEPRGPRTFQHRRRRRASTDGSSTAASTTVSPGADRGRRATAAGPEHGGHGRRRGRLTRDEAAAHASTEKSRSRAGASLHQRAVRTTARGPTSPPYGSVWIPGGVAAGWRPYYNGYWSYGPGGNFWVSYDPWGWAPYHYGRWVFATRTLVLGPRRRLRAPPGSPGTTARATSAGARSTTGTIPARCSYGYVGYDFHCWNFVGYHNIYNHNVAARVRHADRRARRSQQGRRRARAARADPALRTSAGTGIAPPLIVQKARRHEALADRRQRRARCRSARSATESGSRSRARPPACGGCPR